MPDSIRPNEGIWIGMAQNSDLLPPIPLRYIPYAALNKLAETFDSPAVDGQRTLEGLAEAIFKLSGYEIQVDHHTVSRLRDRCKSGESPTVKFIDDLAKFKHANLRILQMAICSLETRADDVLPRALGEIMRRHRNEQSPRVEIPSDRCSQHACSCNDCYYPNNGASLAHSEYNIHNVQYRQSHCDKPDCAHNHRGQPKYKRQTSYPVHNSPRTPSRNNFGSHSVSQNISTLSKIKNDAEKTQITRDFESYTHTMELFRNDFEPPDDFNPYPPSGSEGDDEEDQETNLSLRDTQSETINRPRLNESTRRVHSMPDGPASPCHVNNDPTRRHSDPQPKQRGPARKDCESDGDIPNIPDACTCYRTPIIRIGPKTVFVSLADDSKPHIKEVLTMCTKLQEKGFEVKCDMMESLFTEQNINVNEWLDQCFKKAIFVIFCISPKYHKYIRADNIAEAHASDNKFHTRYIFDRARSEFIRNNSLNRRFLPVLFRNSGAEQKHIPDFLGSTLRYVFPETFNHLTTFMQRHGKNE
ncbi:uncharacterized protein LOC125683025 isoform X1 [Ostrea edulis]|uniref:uncharacterized protein LOC125683025 isoform X1 n=1 Tax=Ostrea edulis TaxID=37623 RepID=UPI0024AE96C4|nr:uncharacterized protein LOC125683025 isoform X1 [Ostrea edulis]